MPSNDEVVWAVPQIQCPTCEHVLVQNGGKIHKFTKEQRKRKFGDGMNYSNESARGYSPAPHVEDQPSCQPEITYIVVTCENERCPQYNKIKVMTVQRIHTPSVKMDLGG